MTVVTKDKAVSSTTKATVNHYFRYKQAQMVFLKGNFYKGGFSMSKNKCKAILDNLAEIQKFVEGAYDEPIAELAEDQVLSL